MKLPFPNLLTRALAAARVAFRRNLFRLHGHLRETVTLQTRQGRLTMFTRDHAIAAQLFVHRQYEYDSSLRAVRFLKAQGFIPRDHVCMLDVGANIGLISTGLLLAGEISATIALEPEPRNFDLLVKNMAQNGLSAKACCLRLAAGDRADRLVLELAPTNPGDHRIRSAPAAGATERQNESLRPTIQVESLPLQAILAQPEVRRTGWPPAFLWIDVQGYEGYVFAGARDVLGGGMPAVAEIWPYGILRAGMSLAAFAATAAGIWSDYWVERRNRFTRYPMTVFDCFLAELGTEGRYENVIFTKGSPANR